MWVVYVREIDPPPGVEPLDWVLYTSLPVTDLDSALRIVLHYELRWLIEEWHKALKTGCRVKARQLQTRERLEPLIGLLGVTAVRLLQLKSTARRAPQTPALEVLPELWVCLLCAARKLRRSPRDLTVRDFYREVAKLGGFLGRTGDGEPGWLTLWRGWDKLTLLIHGANLREEAERLRQKCG